MKENLLIAALVFVLAFDYSIAQNIIMNGGFEELSSCPTSPGEIYLASPWYPGGAGSSDLLNVCGQCNWCTVPTSVGGHQLPHNGLGYSIIGSTIIDFPEAHEVLMQPIKYVLEEGQNYYFEMHVSLCDSVNYAAHNIGVVLVDTILNPWLVLDCMLEGSFDCNPVVENTSANPLTSKTEWTRISGTFTAQGGEKYIFIGNVRPDSLTELEYVGGGGAPNGEFNWDLAAYFIDDVWLSHIDSMHYVGVGEQLAMNNEQLTIWPNPTEGVVNVEFHKRNSTGLVIEVKDLLGRSVLATSAISSKFQMDISALSSGVYCVVVRDKAGGVLVQKVVKK